jgi:acyl dehydratase
VKLRDFCVGAELPPLQVEPISRKLLALFAGASGDHQATHIDIDAARAKGRDDVIVHGMLIMAYMSRLLTDVVPQKRIRSFSTRFVAVTPVHASPRFTGRVVAIDRGLATVELVSHLADGKLVAQGTAVIDISPVGGGPLNGCS